MYRIAVYGKGGIGKSTISANLSHLLSEKGYSVLHIGCDPKHDSTRLLIDGKKIRPFSEDTASDPIHVGINGIYCTECGGAEPGRGCAGKGVELLLSKLEGMVTDYRVYDVLGDVVCGGFSVPARSRYTDGIIIVTSGEFMSIYAANNILRGLTTINPKNSVFGIVFNRRGNIDEEKPVEMFAQATGLPILCDIPRSKVFKDAESLGKTASIAYPDCEEISSLKMLADYISSNPKRFDPKPLSEQAMMEIAAGHEPKSNNTRTIKKRCTFDSIDPERNLTYTGNYVMPACTSHGAVDAAMKISNAAVILHGPRNCAYLMEYAYRRRILYTSPEHDGRIPDPGLYSTNLNSEGAFRDTEDSILEAVLRAKSDGYRYAFLIPTCSTEIMGTDLKHVATRISRNHGIEVMPVAADSMFLGSKFGGTIGLFDSIISRFEPRVTEKGSVNMIARWFYATGKDENLEWMNELLSLMGLRLNVRLMDFCTMEQLSNFCSAEYDFQLGDARMNSIICEHISKITGRRRALMLDVPIGLGECIDWIRRIAEYAPETANRLQEAEKELTTQYEKGIDPIRKRLSGKKTIIYCIMVRDLKWEVEILRSLDVDIRAIMFSDGNVIDHNIKVPDYGDIPIVNGAKLCDLRKIVDNEDIDLIITNNIDRVARSGMRWATMAPRIYGIKGAIEWAQLISDSMRVPCGRWEAEL